MGEKYPALTAYRQKVEVDYYAIRIKELLDSLKNRYGYSDLDAMLVLKDILSHVCNVKKQPSRSTSRWTANNREISGNILIDAISSLDMTLTDSVFGGAVNTDGKGGSVKVTLSGSPARTLTADSYITEFDGDISQITANGFYLYVNGEAVV